MKVKGHKFLRLRLGEFPHLGVYTSMVQAWESVLRVFPSWLLTPTIVTDPYNSKMGKETRPSTTVQVLGAQGNSVE
jgi:hypothetical protein